MTTKKVDATVAIAVIQLREAGSQDLADQIEKLHKAAKKPTKLKTLEELVGTRDRLAFMEATSSKDRVWMRSLRPGDTVWAVPNRYLLNEGKEVKPIKLTISRYRARSAGNRNRPLKGCGCHCPEHARPKSPIQVGNHHYGSANVFLSVVPDGVEFEDYTKSDEVPLDGLYRNEAEVWQVFVAEAHFPTKAVMDEAMSLDLKNRKATLEYAKKGVKRAEDAIKEAQDGVREVRKEHKQRWANIEKVLEAAKKAGAKLPPPEEIGDA